ncbi:MULTISPECIES: DUF3634 family protein [unclassified Thioalkalivibrio]|uniref:DUF3634 family protein n=1 Tax=unclassified Thioalkalivibrio TaxID=2621013 RepID=UPI00037C51B3|nr:MULTISPECIES: DUF3634 family protein [unclassified Thioalkalivibrio]
MMFIAFVLMIGFLIIAAVLLVWQVSILFSVVIEEDGSVHTTRGDPPRNFLHAVREVVSRHGLQGGRITAVRGRDGVRVRCSRRVPEEARAHLQAAAERVKVGRRRRGRKKRR